ncbi:hypothetical protein [Borrelia sp. RT1S]|uniref:hypothetical protein n=1 Tax=Borrelia sp. RT1S TaxID=2898580 RepID=UPI001E48F3B6|nr:hypothetical protein [Borrelia sp. RT1S]UGQ17971.1 hypothetical protein LSO05_05925 [Borrelia sp. RT1S]
MKKFSIMFFLILVVALFACKQEEAGEKSEETPTTTPTTKTAKELADEAAKKAEDEKKKKDEEAAEKKAREEALTALKGEITTYKTKMTNAKTTFDGLSSNKNEVAVPTQVTDVKTTDKDKIQASLGYDSALHKELNETVTALQLSGSSKTAEIKTVNDLLKMLVNLDDATKKILDTHLKGDNLAKIEKDKAKIEKATKELKEFIASRDEFIASAKATIKAAHTAKSTASTAKTELDKISDTTAVTTSTKAGEAGYCHAKLEAIKANETALGDLVK